MDAGRIIALDLGRKRTGVALSDASQIISTPLTVLDMTKKHKGWLEDLKLLIEENEVSKIVVGVPYDADGGEEGRAAKMVRPYIALLRERFELPVVEWDESFTSNRAEQTLLEADLSRKRRKQVIDKVAAALLLQDYLDTEKGPF